MLFLVVCHSSEEHQIRSDILNVSSQTPVPQLLGDLIEKGIARKFYLSIIIERHRVEALLDTGADITLMSTELLKELLICTDSNYARLSFTCHLTGWKRNGFKTANKQACQAPGTLPSKRRHHH